jgi:hypothetical protein
MAAFLLKTARYRETSARIPSIRVSRASGHPTSKSNFPVFRSAATQTPGIEGMTDVPLAASISGCVAHLPTFAHFGLRWYGQARNPWGQSGYILVALQASRPCALTHPERCPGETPALSCLRSCCRARAVVRRWRGVTVETPHEPGEIDRERRPLARRTLHKDGSTMGRHNPMHD